MARIKRKKWKRKEFFWLLVIVIITNTIIFLNIWHKTLSNKVLDIAVVKLEEISSSIFLTEMKRSVVNNISVDDVLIVTKNSEGEILTIDYNLKEVYKVLNEVSNDLNTIINEVENGNINQFNYINEPFLDRNSENGLVVLIPLGSSLNSSLWANVGPKIPAKISFVGNIWTNLKTKATSYGFNNAILEIYLEIEINNTIVLPNAKKETILKKEILLSAKAIQGQMLDLNNGTILEKSNGLSIPID